MKSYLICCALFYSIAVASAAFDPAATKCIEQAECEDGECCVGYPPFGGVCSNFTAEGGKCHVEDKTVPIFGDFYIATCPCAEGLVCIQEGTKKNDGICQVPPTTVAPEPAAEEAADEPAADAEPADAE